MFAFASIPFCGTAAGATAWTLDPVLIGAIMALVAAYGLGVRLVGSSGPTGERVALLAGRCIVAAALISPLFYLSVALL